MTRTLANALTATRVAKMNLNAARADLDSLIRRNRDDSNLCTAEQVNHGWDRVERAHTAYRAAKAAYHAACA